MLLSIITVNLNNKSGLVSTYKSISDVLINEDDVEWVVVDGKSHDGSVEFLKNISLSTRYMFKSARDSGIYDAMNKGIRMSNGKFLWFLNSGDTAMNVCLMLEKIRLFPVKDYFEFAVVNDDWRYTYYNGKFTAPHQGMIYKRRVFDICGQYRNYKLISDRLLYDEIKRRGLAYEKFGLPICLYNMEGISLSKESKSKERREFIDAFDWRSLRSLIRVILCVLNAIR